jgi:outer membrane protein assembly factor BamA
MLDPRSRGRIGGILLALLLSLFPAAELHAQKEVIDEDSSEVKKFGWLAYTYVFLSPETNLAFGLGGIVYFRLSPDSTIKPSSITPSAYYSINDQYDLTIIPEFYLGSKFYIYSYFSTGLYIDKFYGLGPESEEIDNPEYEHHTTVIQLNLQPQISKYIRAGLYSRVLFKSISDPHTNPFILSGSVTGTGGGTSVGLGGVIARDTRDQRFYPTDGQLNEIRMVFYSSVWGSEYDYNKLEIDLRGYVSIGTEPKHVLGMQLYGVFCSTHTPFYDDAMLGGKTIMRGYYLGRYRDNALLAGQFEYRTRIWWRIGGVVFMGAGEVMPKMKDFRVKSLQYSYGFGLRFQFDVVEKIDIRADFGFGKGTSGVYFDVQQAF